jgi:O-antigen biosynthesis protein
MTTSSVSVIIPCFRQAHLLRDALESVLAQTGAHIEVVVVSDGSPDDPESVVDRFGGRVRYISQPNRGSAAARNAGFAATGGDFVQFLDADDVLMPDKLAHQAQVLSEAPDADVCYGDYEKVEIETQTRLPRPRVRMQGDCLRDVLTNWETDLSIPIHAALFRRSLWGERLPFPELLRGKEDWVMWIDLLARGKRAIYLDEMSAIYRIHGNGKCSDPLRMHAAILQMVPVVRNLTPPRYHSCFEEHAWDLCDRYVREGLFRQVPDYKRLYQEVSGNLQAVTESRSWRLASFISKLAAPLRWLQAGCRRPSGAAPVPEDRGTSR